MIKRSILAVAQVAGLTAFFMTKDAWWATSVFEGVAILDMVIIVFWLVKDIVPEEEKTFSEAPRPLKNKIAERAMDR